QQDSMPRSAVASGAVDFILPPDEIAREIGRIARHPFVAPGTPESEESLREAELGQILSVLRNGTEVDFSGYKRNTLVRRINRRMVLHKLHGMKEYVAFLHKNPQEVESLFQDVLVSVTRFFRDPESFETIKTRVLPQVIEG